MQSCISNPLLDIQTVYDFDYRAEYQSHSSKFKMNVFEWSWLVGCFGFNGPLRQYFSLYRAVSQREGERGEKGQSRVKMSKQAPTRTYCKRRRPLPYYHPNCRTPRHWKFTQDHRTTRPTLRMES